jgi:hypothetical protein
MGRLSVSARQAGSRHRLAGNIPRCVEAAPYYVPSTGERLPDHEAEMSQFLDAPSRAVRLWASQHPLEVLEISTIERAAKSGSGRRATPGQYMSNLNPRKEHPLSSRQNAKQHAIPLPAEFMAPSPPRYMLLQDALRITNSCLFSEWLGRRFGCLVTITWKQCNVSADMLPPSTANLQEHVFDRLTRVFRQAGLPFQACWWHEYAVKMKHHLHAHIHLPPGSDAVARARVIDTLNQALKPDPCGTDFGWHGKLDIAGYTKRHEMKRQVIYAIKNLSPTQRARLPDGTMVNIRDYLDLAGAAAVVRRNPLGAPQPMPPGFRGKLVGASQNVGPKARAAAGWIELTTLPDLRAAIWAGYSPLNDAVTPPQPAKRKPRR